jgi:putative phosphoribosyl transferase
VLGIPRGGIVVADVIAQVLSCQLGIIIPRRLSAPDNKELTVSAVMYDRFIYMNEFIVRELGISQEYIQEEKLRQLQEIRRMASLYDSGNVTSKGQNNIVP